MAALFLSETYTRITEIKSQETMALPFPHKADDFNPQWLTETLNRTGFLPSGKVSELSYKEIGTGKLGDNIRLSLHYDEQAAAHNPPISLVAKLPAADPIAREMASSSGAYRREVLFYQREAKLTSIRLPRIYHSEASDQGAEFVILMEDLAPATAGDQRIGESLAHARLSIAEAAKLHAPFWGKEDQLGEHITRHYLPDAAEYGGALLIDAWPKFLQRFGSGLNRDCSQFGEHFCQQYSQWIQRYEGEKTLTHYDFRSENILYNDSDAQTSATVVDWQSLSVSSGLSDIAYFLGVSLDTATRRAEEKTLLEGYRKQLAALGVTLKAEDCWQQYREFSMSGFMTVILGAVYTAAEARSDEMFLAMAQQQLQQCVDLNASEFL